MIVVGSYRPISGCSVLFSVFIAYSKCKFMENIWIQKELEGKKDFVGFAYSWSDSENNDTYWETVFIIQGDMRCCLLHLHTNMLGLSDTNGDFSLVVNTQSCW